jgi:hypothetical protein
MSQDSGLVKLPWKEGVASLCATNATIAVPIEARCFTNDDGGSIESAYRRNFNHRKSPRRERCRKRRVGCPSGENQEEERK